MANPDTPFGLKPVRHKSGCCYDGAATAMYKNSGYGTAVYIGDPVLVVAGGSNSAAVGEFQPGTLQEVELAAAGGYISGVVVGIRPDPNNLQRTYSPASTEAVLFVCTDPDVLYEIQEVSGGTALTAAAVGLNASFVYAAGSTYTGLSGVELDNSTEATTQALELKIRGLVDRADNVIGEHAKWLVQINLHSFAQGVGTAGV
ncbi:MAG: hypothetical protein HQL90_04240 [Magnetococcales bacterium]|nr:hypothetical protein [Magnetococcales bacterium]